ncbi:DUF2278 family protein [Cupriavidus basilensis]
MPIIADLAALAPGLHENGFPRLDYVRDAGLVDFPNMRPIALDTETERNDINALVDDMLMLDRNSPTPIDYIYHGSSGDDDRKGWPPRTDVMGLWLWLPVRAAAQRPARNPHEPGATRSCIRRV